MKLAHDNLSPEDRDLLRRLWRRLEPHATELAADWAQAWERALPCRVADPGAYRQMVEYLALQSVEAVAGFLAAGDLEGLYDFQYRNNREGAARQLLPGALPVYSQRDLHLAGRSGQPVMKRWIERLFGADPVESLQVQLAQERLGAQLDTLLGEAYSDEREGHLEALGERLHGALRLSERLRLLGQTIAQSLDIDPVLDAALQTALELLAGDSCGLTLANAEGTAIQVRRLLGGDPSFVGQWAPVEGNLSGWVFRYDRIARSDRERPEVLERSRTVIDRLGIRAYLVVPLRSGGRPIGSLGVSWQTERKFTSDEVHLLQSLADVVAVAIRNASAHGEVRDALRDAEQANRAKSEFVAAVSHEIRSPLSALLGYADLLADGGFGAVSAEQRDVLGRMRSVALSTLHLTDDLLDHARIESGALPVQLGDVPLGPLLEEVSDHARMIIGDKRIEFSASSRTEVECVCADRGRLRQVLVNLIGNAVKFTPEGAVRLVVSQSATPGVIDIAVQDTGIGISAHDLARLFTLFYRAEGTAKTPGAGIGLFLSRQLARAMGGDLEVTSEPGRGSTFTVSVRAA